MPKESGALAAQLQDAAAVASLRPDPALKYFIEDELLPGLGMDATRFWSSLDDIVERFTPENRALLEVRDDLQAKIDRYHRSAARAADEPSTEAAPGSAADYRAFLVDIGYLEADVEPFEIGTANVDPEIAEIAGPQLVVPVNNARFAINAANARWGSLYDALYGSDVIPSTPGLEPGDSYNPRRGKAVVARAASFLDTAAPLADGSHEAVAEYVLAIDDGRARLGVRLDTGAATGLKDPAQFVGYHIVGDATRLLFENHGLHVELHIDPGHPVGRASRNGLCDVVLEAAPTTIQDCEDSVAAVDAGDKVTVYRNWLGLMRGDLAATFDKAGKSLRRTLAKDRDYLSPAGRRFALPGRSLMLVRNVGLLMTTPALYDGQGDEVFEGILDAVLTTACALHDVRKSGARSNSRTGSIYIVKPKLHGSREVAFTDSLFAAVEDMFGLPRNTIKIGVMDEERRTSVNLEACIHAVRERIVFINTGFLDRTGDEIHTWMEAGPVLPKRDIKAQGWIRAYEDRNVDIGLRCGFPGRAQIGKGMWPKPDEMKAMLDSKIEHPLAGASCAWVPSPTAATLHAMHYHQVDVASVQADLEERCVATVDELLQPPLCDPDSLSKEDIQRELDNNAQGILGYVVRWIDQGVGCSKVPDIDNTGLMEDRATLRISSQHIANWLHHGVCDEAQVMETFRRMAVVVDRQNEGDPDYKPMAPGFDGVAFKTACALALDGRSQPNGYTEPLLHGNRRRIKAGSGDLGRA